MTLTLGDLVDRLSIVNIKLFVVQDEVHAAADEKRGVSADTVQKLKHLNLERSRLMSAIDQCLADAVKSGTARVDPRVKIA